MTESDDERLIGGLARDGCDMTKQREVGLFFFAPSEEVAGAVGRDLRADGWDSQILAHHGEWIAFANGRWMVVDSESIAKLRRFAEDVADRNGATYHGWQAKLDPGLTVI